MSSDDLKIPTFFKVAWVISLLIGLSVLATIAWLIWFAIVRFS